MVTRAKKFTPEVLLSAPRRSAGIPNPSGTIVAYTVSTYDFDEHKKRTSFETLSVSDSSTNLVVEGKDISDPVWISDGELVYLQANHSGDTELWYLDVEQSSVQGDSSHSYAIDTIAATASDLKVRRLDQHSFAVIVSAEHSSGHSNKTLRSSGKLYTSLFVRHWDRYEDGTKKTLVYGQLSRSTSNRYELSRLIDALEHTGLECPIRPFGGADCFDISRNRLIFTAKDPESNPALNTKVNVYLQTISAWTAPPNGAPELLDLPDYDGAKSSPVFSPDGSKAAFLAMKQNGYEADRNRIFVLSDVKFASSATVLQTDDKDFFSRSPSSLTWTLDGTTLLAAVEDHGFSKLMTLPLNPSGIVQPIVLAIPGSVSQINPVKESKILLSGTSLIDNSLFYMVNLPHDASTIPAQVWTHSSSAHGNRFGLSHKQISDIWTPASNPNVNAMVHSWVVRPSNFDSTKKYPVAYLIHGGPQGSWTNSWSTRWNPAVFAEQGYIVVAPNPTGSTGYGQAFTDAIQHNWGGDPYHDIVNVFEWVGEHLPGADNDRAVALGASYGGYMMNWIQGHDLGRKFKALVCHDGIFACANMLSTEELYFPFHDLGGTPFYDPSKVRQMQDLAKFKHATYSSWKQWDPSEHLDKWETPELVVHSSKDYRICISEGLAAFNVLQARGIDSQFLTFPDENHWVLKPENSLLWHKVVLNWINKYVGLPAYTSLSPEDELFFGGVRQEQHALGASMPAQGKPET